ncbi:hypothetical protein [Humibacter ginsengisoli]
MDARVSPIRADVDADVAVEFEDEAWLSTEVSIDPVSGERSDPFETVSAHTDPRG